MIGVVVSAVLPVKPEGHGAAWGWLLAEQKQIRQWVTKGLTVVKIGVLLERRGVVARLQLGEKSREAILRVRTDSQIEPRRPAAAMARRMRGDTGRVKCVVGLHARTGAAEAVALAVWGGAASSVAFRGRWSLDLIEDRAERQVYHAVADLPLARAETMVRREMDAVADIAVRHLSSIIGSLGSVDAIGVIVGDFPVPDSLSSILVAHTLMHAAEGALFRDALLDAATACGVPGIGVSRNLATDLLGGGYADAVAVVGSAAGRPWRKDHKLATIAAIISADSATS